MLRQLITAETLEGEELEAAFNEAIDAQPADPESRVKPPPVAVEYSGEDKPRRKKTPTLSQLMPKQSPAH